MSDQNPEVPAQPDLEPAPEQLAEAVAEQAPEAAETVVAATDTVAELPPPPADAGSVPPPPPAFAAPAAALVPVFPNGKPMLDAAGNPVSDKSRLAAALLCFFFGGLGIHRFYVGKIGTGIAIICTLGGFFGIWPLVDLILILLGTFRDKPGKALQNW
jgi:TM2 domain-containing membrane protein YozV